MSFSKGSGKGMSRIPEGTKEADLDCLYQKHILKCLGAEFGLKVK